MKTNDLKSGTNVILENGFKARIEDNKRGKIRMMTVYGICTEMGSVYAHEIKAYADSDGVMHTDIELTDEQKTLKHFITAHR